MHYYYYYVIIIGTDYHNFSTDFGNTRNGYKVFLLLMSLFLSDAYYCVIRSLFSNISASSSSCASIYPWRCYEKSVVKAHATACMLSLVGLTDIHRNKCCVQGKRSRLPLSIFVFLFLLFITNIKLILFLPRMIMIMDSKTQFFL